jgi:hypothetical protein
MATSLSIKKPEGVPIIGYKAYKNYSSVYAGGCASFRGLSQGATYYTYFLHKNPVSKSGTLKTLLLGGIPGGLGIDTVLNIRLAVWNPTEISGEPAWEISTILGTEQKYTYQTFLGSDSSRNLPFEIDLGTGIPVVAGQVLSIQTQYGAGSSGLNISSNVRQETGYHPRLSAVDLGADSFPNSPTVLSDFDYDYNYINCGHLSVELIGDMEGTWTEITDGGCGIDTAIYETTDIPSDNVWYTVDLGASYDLSFLYIYGQYPANNPARFNTQIQISDTGLDGSWIDIYLGDLHYYGTVEYSSGYVGFPFTARYIKYKITDPLSYHNMPSEDFYFRVYASKTTYDGFKFPKASDTANELIRLDSGYDTRPYWYKIVPIDTSGQPGTGSIIVSNRHNIV